MEREDKLKNLILGNTVLLATILFHLAYESLLLTDFIGIIGIGIIISECMKKGI